MLETTGMFDYQVPYYQPAKRVARLRRKKTDANPLLFHIDMDAGHGCVPGRFKSFKQQAMNFAFLLSRRGHTK